jgi:hypothetical protein
MVAAAGPAQMAAAAGPTQMVAAAARLRWWRRRPDSDCGGGGPGPPARDVGEALQRRLDLRGRPEEPPLEHVISCLGFGGLGFGRGEGRVRQWTPP